MPKSLISQYTDEEFIQIWNMSSSMKNFSENLGYKTYTGDAGQRIRKRVDELNLSDEHFIVKRPIKRTEENIFCENSTASQKTLRKWYKKGQYSKYKCSICGQEPFWNGQELSLTLDHINGDNHNNKLENLRWVCPNCDRQLDTFGSKNRTHLPKKKFYCVDCGKEISNRSTRCEICARKELSKQTIEKQIDRNTLKEKIRNQSFESIAREYNKTSGNAIKKWCDYYNLPRLKSEIKKYSDEEWAAV